MFAEIKLKLALLTPTTILCPLTKDLDKSRAIAQAVSRWLSTAAAGVRARTGHVGFVIDKVALGQVFSKYFIFFCQLALHRLLHNHHHHLSSGVGTICQ
jgi:hypothetical protein